MKFDTKDGLSLVGRLLISGIFIGAGINKFRQAQMTKEYMAAKKLPLIPIAEPAVGIFELLAGLSLIAGYKPRAGAAASFLYLIPTTVIFHDFWKSAPEQQSEQMVNFLKNLAIMGGLLQIIAHGSGRAAVERSQGFESPVREIVREITQLRHAG